MATARAYSASYVLATDGAVCRIDIDAVAPRPAVDLVVEAVVRGLDVVVAVAAEEDVEADVVLEVVVAWPAVEAVVLGVALEVVVAGAADEGVVVLAAL
jgi:hypothetical protein